MKKSNDTHIESKFNNFFCSPHCPCLCEAVKLILVWCRFIGVLPICSVRHPQQDGCSFKISKKALYYSYTLQFFLVVYMSVAYVWRFVCGPETSISKGMEWYVMTVGYFVSDLDILLTLSAGTAYSTRICLLLNKLSKISCSNSESRKLGGLLYRCLIVLLVVFCVDFASYVYFGWLRSETEFNGSFYCTFLDQPFGVVIRGAMVIISTIQISAVFMFVLMISVKFQDLSKAVNVAVRSFSSKENQENMEYVIRTHQEIFESADEINRCFGLQLLMTVSSSLYTIIYYLYRYSMTDTNGYIQARLHYFFGLAFRFGKLMTYIVLGEMITCNSQKPLEVLKNNDLFNLPTERKLQIQMMILQWMGKVATLSGLGVVHLGPWLLAPIVGNVITYLLVALQFKDTTSMPVNITNLESVFLNK